MLRIFIISLLFGLIVEAGTYPRLFSQMGTPLYEADEAFAKVETIAPLKEQIGAYRSLCAITLETGRDIESGRDVEKEELTAYFSALRVLQIKHDDVVSAMERELRRAITVNDYGSVMALVESRVEGLFAQPSLRKLLVGYYEKHRSKGKNAFLETMARDLEAVPRYSDTHMPSEQITTKQTAVSKKQADRKKLILLTTSWCPACKQAKAQLRSQGIAFTEYDIERSSTGKKLYRERNGRAIPMVIIGDDYRTGLSMQWVRERLEQ